MNKYTRLGKNIVLVFIGNAGSRLIGLLMLPFYTRWLSVEDYGTTDIINVYVTLLLGLATACIAEAVFVFPKSQSTEKQKAYFSSGLCFAFFSLVLTALLFKLITTVFAYKKLSNSFTDNAWIVYGLVVTTFLQQYIQQFVRSIDKMKIYSTTGIVLTVCIALFSCIMIPCWGVFGYVSALMLANLAAAVYALLCSGAFRYFSIGLMKKTVCIEMVLFSIPLIPTTIMWWLVNALNRPLIEHYIGMHGLGIFGIAAKFSGIVTALFSVFGVSWQISVMEEFGKEGYSSFFNRMFRLITTGLLFLFLIITISSTLIVRIFTTHEFYEAWLYIPITTLGAVLQSIGSLAGSNFAAAKKSKYFLYSAIWVIISSAVCNLLLIPRFGIMGAALSLPISFTVVTVSRMVYGWKYVKIENITHYILMILLGILVIVTMRSIQMIWLKSILLLFLFALFIGINYRLKEDFCKLYQKIKERLK